MAVVLATGLKCDGKFFEEGTDVSSLPRKIVAIAKKAGILKAVLDEIDLELVEDTPEDKEEEEEEED